MVTLVTLFAPSAGRATVSVPSSRTAAHSGTEGSRLIREEQQPRANTPAETLNAAAKETQGRVSLPLLLATAARMRLERSFPGKVVDWTSLTKPQEKNTAVLGLGSTDTYDYHFRRVVDGGDLDGNGSHDVLVYEGVERSRHDFLFYSFDLVSLTVTARRGGDGTALWSKELVDGGRRPFDTFLIPLGRDVTGDGRADLLLHSLIVHSDTRPPCVYFIVCAGNGSARYTWETSVIEGTTGAAAWTRQLNGESEYTVVFAYGVAAIGRVVVAHATNEFVDVAASGDLDGDHLGDLVSNSYDSNSTIAYGFAAAIAAIAGAGIYDTQTVTHARGISAVSGRQVFAKDSEPTAGWTLALPAGDATGDGLADILWQQMDIKTTHGLFACGGVLFLICVTPGETTATSLAMLAAPDFDAAWQTAAPETNGWAEAAIGDLNGDGRSDMGFVGYDRQYAIDGHTGTVMWQRQITSWMPFVNIGPVGGSAGDDLLISSYTGDTYETKVLSRIDGATGDVLLQTEHSSSEFTYAWTQVMGDADGDGALDIAVQRSTSIPDGQGYNVVETSSVAIESGRTGGTLGTETRDGYVSWDTFGDLNGDGLADLLRIELSNMNTLTALISPALHPLWSRDGHFSYGGDNTVGLGNVDGVAGNDLVLTTIADDYTGRSRFDIVSGATGLIVWGAGDQIDNRFPGSVTGTVQSSGTPIANICVDAFQNHGLVSRDRTDSSGMYQLRYLPPGEYIMVFNTCEPSRYQKQWYPGASSEQAATPVTVQAATVTGGINADLASLPAPENDNVADAIPIVRLQTSKQDLGGPTLQPGEPGCGGEGSVWYRFNATGPQVPLFVTVQGVFVKTLGIYDGADAFEATEIRCGQGQSSRDVSESFLPEDGHTYWIQVGVIGPYGGELTIRLNPAPSLLG